MRILLTLSFLLLAAVCAPLHAGESPTVTDKEAEMMTQTLGNLQDLSGLHGGNAEDMNKFLSMVESPGMVEVMKKLNAQMGSGDLKLEDVDAFVRENLTAEDVEKILGYKVNQEDLDKALSKQTDPEELNNMLRLIMQDQNEKK